MTQQSNEKRAKLTRAVVVSNAMDKTAVVKVERKIQHPVYGKYIKRTSKRSIHDPENKCQVGDVVLIKQVRPLSKNKTWQLVEITS